MWNLYFCYGKKNNKIEIQYVGICQEHPEKGYAFEFDNDEVPVVFEDPREKFNTNFRFS